MTAERLLQSIPFCPKCSSPLFVSPALTFDEVDHPVMGDLSVQRECVVLACSGCEFCEEVPIPTSSRDD